MSGQIAENCILTGLSELLDRPVDAASLARARWHLLDWAGCAIAGAKEPAGAILRETQGAGAAAEAFCWGGLGNILEMDDVDKRALLHPGPSIVPAALAMAEIAQPSFETLLIAIVKGYEATIRVGRAVGPGHYALWHNTGTCGPIGAAAACAILLNADQRQLAHAMALAMSQATGLWQTRHDPVSMGKQLHTANAARAGFEAARLASAGFTGPLDILEGEQGFFAATCPDGDPAAVLVAPSSDWMIHEVSFKPWPACRHAHAVIDAALELRERVDWQGDAPIRVETYLDALKFCDRSRPQTVIEGKFSLQHAVAVSLARGAPSLEHFELNALNDPDLATLRARVRVESSAEFDSVYPAHFGARVSLGDQSVTIEDAMGDPENPVSETQIKDKARMLMQAGGVSDAIARNFIEKIQNATGSVETTLKLIREALA
ncbi:MAG: MmgE/PrpD family protein [Henriciella sp.]|nr:MmgE/PrpD family protein [Henriciella sp.]